MLLRSARLGWLCGQELVGRWGLVLDRVEYVELRCVGAQAQACGDSDHNPCGDVEPMCQDVIGNMAVEAAHDFGAFGFAQGQELALFGDLIDGEPVDGLRIISGLTFNDAKLRRTEGGVNEGKDAVGVGTMTGS